LQRDWQPKPGDVVVRRPRESEIAPVQLHIEPRTVSVRGPTSPMMLVYGFLGITALGTLLLVLPLSNSGSGFTPFFDALFTATSAVTVTGLVVVDTPVAWSTFGQVVIAILIFIGGLGFMTGAAFLLLIVGQRIGLRGRLALTEGVGFGQLGSVVGLVRNIVILALSVQILGTVLLFLRFYVFGTLWPGITAGQALWQSAFQAVSAFNNAGFVILPANRLGGASLIPFAGDYIVLAIMGGLIIVGGLGYAVLRDLAVVRRITGLSLDTKLVLLGSIALTVLGAVAFLACEYSRPGTLGEMGVGDKVANAAFHSVTTRTAGFNTMDYGEISDQSGIVTEALMFIGGASASTAGGIKINTFMVVAIAAFATVRSRRYVSAFRREISLVVIRRAMVVGAVASVFLAVVVFTLAALESDVALRDIMFEAFSAFGTVGLSTGITSTLGDAARVVLVVAMFVGRLGPLTMALLMAGREVHQFYRLAEEHVRIG